MNKNRLEALSDGVFSIVMTLLIFNIAVPTIQGTPTDAAVLQDLLKLWPLLASYFTSFAVLAMFWISHNFFYHSFTLEVNRKLVLLNMLYLSLLALIPFSTRLLGQYEDVRIAVLVYGLNVFLIGIVATFVLHYAIYSHEIDISHIEPRLLRQARVRSLITPTFAAIGIIAAYFSTPLALLCFAFPVVFNLVPGMLNFAEQIFGFTL